MHTLIQSPQDTLWSYYTEVMVSQYCITLCIVFLSWNHRQRIMPALYASPLHLTFCWTQHLMWGESLGIYIGKYKANPRAHSGLWLLLLCHISISIHRICIRIFLQRGEMFTEICFVVELRRVHAEMGQVNACVWSTVALGVWNSFYFSNKVLCLVLQGNYSCGYLLLTIFIC